MADDDVIRLLTEVSGAPEAWEVRTFSVSLFPRDDDPTMTYRTVTVEVWDHGPRARLGQYQVQVTEAGGKIWLCGEKPSLRGAFADVPWADVKRDARAGD